MSISSVNSSSYLYDYGTKNGTQKTSSGKDSGEDSFFSKIDANQDGTVDQSELGTLVDDIVASDGQKIDVSSEFSKYDTDNSGSLSDDELRAFMEGNDLKPTGGHMGPPPQGQAAGSDQYTDQTAATTDDFSLTEYVMSLLSSMQNSLFGSDTDDGEQTTGQQVGSVQSATPYQSNYDQVMQKTQSQYSAQA